MYVILFDIDGTLVKTGGAGQDAMKESLQRLGAPGHIGDVSFMGRTDRAIIGQLLRLHGIEPTEPLRQTFIEHYVERLEVMLPRRPGELLPGIAEVLEVLDRRSDVALGLLTGNLRAGAEIKLRHFGIDRYFPFGGFGDIHEGRDDVAAVALREAEAFLNRPIDPRRVWVVGDTPLDVQCARAIGGRALAVATGWNSSEELLASGPDLMLDDMTRPEAWLEYLQ